MRLSVRLLLWLLVCLLPGPVNAAPTVDLETALKSIPAYAPDRVLVRFKPGTAAASIADLHRQAGGQRLKTLPRIGVEVIKIPRGRVQQTVQRYRANPNVEFAEPDYHRVLVLPTEGSDLPPPDGTGADFFPEQWGLNNTGQTLIDPNTGLPSLVGTPDADIDAPQGWDISSGSSSVKIAVLDTGIDCAAVDLAGKCVEQISFVTDYSSTLDDIVAHGTHVAGIAAANTDNAKGTAGTGWQTSLGSLKACYEHQIDLLPPLGFYVTVGVCPVSASAAAITHAADNGYHVINMSYGSDVMSFSTFGNTWVSMIAPGENIISTEPDISCLLFVSGYTPGVDDCLTWKSGTSMASPHVAGAAALVWAQLYPGQAPSGCVASNGMPCNSVVRSFLENGADSSGALGQNFLAWSQNGRLNLFNMLSDGDGDTVISPADNCPDIANFDQANNDGDSEGDACDGDDDNDGLSDSLEISVGTNPLLADSDGDTLSDFDEFNYDGDPGSYTPGQDLNPLQADSDSDGLRDDTDPIPLTFNFNDGDLAPLGAPDGDTNAADLLIGQRIALGLITSTVLELAHGDLYPPGAPDGVINLQDLILLQQLVTAP
jgi:thermitase